MIYVQLIYIFSIIFEVSSAKGYGGVWVLYLSEVSFLEKLFIFSCNGSLLLCIDFL